MAHPFEKMFERALKKHTEGENAVLREAEKLRGKGYSETEICAVLRKLEKHLVDERSCTVVHEAREALCGEDA